LTNDACRTAAVLTIEIVEALEKVARLRTDRKRAFLAAANDGLNQMEIARQIDAELRARGFEPDTHKQLGVGHDSVRRVIEAAV